MNVNSIWLHCFSGSLLPSQPISHSCRESTVAVFVMLVSDPAGKTVSLWFFHSLPRLRAEEMIAREAKALLPQKAQGVMTLQLMLPKRSTCSNPSTLPHCPLARNAAG